MIKNKSRIQKIIVASVFLVALLLSNTIAISTISLNNNGTFFDDPYSKNLHLANSNVDDFINGTGSDQEVRVYMENQSSSYNNNNGAFNISAPGSNSYLTSGNFLFEFQNNYTTSYTLEDNNALELPRKQDYIRYEMDNTISNFTIYNGTNINGGTFDTLIDNNQYVHLNATNGLINFTIDANFTNRRFDIDPTSGIHYLYFNRTQILGFILLFLFNLSVNANLTVNMWDSVQSTWKNVVETFEVDSTLGEYQLAERIINSYTNLIDNKDTGYIQFIFERYDAGNFEVTLNDFEFTSLYAFDIPISDENRVALEFDLKGKSTLVHGFYAWIRTLNLTEAINTELNITLYKANTTLNQRTSSNLQQDNLEPDQIQMEYTITLKNYNLDEPYYFEFNQSKIINLELFNYFFVLKTNNSKEIYRLISIPFSTYGDGTTEHELRTSPDNGITWNVARKLIDQGFISEPLDASSFTLNVTRGYIPSDFNISGSPLAIQEIPVQDTQVKYFADRFSAEWGVGLWNDNFTNHIEVGISDEFEIQLTWNKTITNDFFFNVSYYAISYSKQTSSVTFKVSYDGIPSWNLDYNLNLGSSIFNNWNFTEFWYIFPNYFDSQILLNPNSNDILGDLDPETTLVTNINYEKMIVPKSKALISGLYALNLTSFNAVSKMSSYINFKDTLWKTQGFMFGDNISVSLNIKGPDNVAPASGFANVSLYFPNGTLYKKLNSSSGFRISEGSILKYDFNNVTILNLTKEIPVLGRYHLGYFWTNGSSIGCKKIPIYITDYDINIYGVDYKPEDNENTIQGRINKIVENYNMLVATVNQTNQRNPGFYPVNNSNLDKTYSFDFNGENVQVKLNSFLQNETVLNPSEDVNFKFLLQNLYTLSDIDVKVSVKLVSLANEEWIIAQKTSNILNLKRKGDPSSADNGQISLNLQIPEMRPDGTWYGVNAPIRKAGAKVVATLYIEGKEAGTHIGGQNSLLINQTDSQFEGYIIRLKSSVSSSIGILKHFDRKDCVYLPDNTTFIFNVYDKNYVSSYEEFVYSFGFKLDSEFQNVTYTPKNIIYGEEISLVSFLKTEFGKVLGNRNISLYQYSQDKWNLLENTTSDADGRIQFMLDTIDLEQINSEIKLKLAWNGEELILNNSREITIPVVIQKVNLSISYKVKYSAVYRGTQPAITLTLSNMGDATLRIKNLELEFSSSISYYIVQENQLELNQFEPGESSTVIFRLNIPNNAPNKLIANISVVATNLITNQDESVKEPVEISVISYPFYQYFIDYFIFLILAIIGIVWILAIVYARRIMKKIETPEEKEEKEKPKKGKYLKVEEAEKEAKKKKETSTDLDSLLEDEGLKD